MGETRESLRARLLAERILDRWHGDPDDDLAILARAVVRLSDAVAETVPSITDDPDYYPNTDYERGYADGRAAAAGPSQTPSDASEPLGVAPDASGEGT